MSKEQLFISDAAQSGKTQRNVRAANERKRFKLFYSRRATAERRDACGNYHATYICVTLNRFSTSQDDDDDDDEEEEGGSIQALLDLLPLAAPILEELSDVINRDKR